MKISAKTDVGKLRDSNQDKYAIGEYGDGSVWAVVCDGMGGHSGGNIASTIAVESIGKSISSAIKDGADTNAVKNIMISAVSAANLRIFDVAADDESLHGMGTTAVVVIAVGNKAYIAHVGDSRCYLIRDNAVQLTKDHSLVQELVDAGMISSDEAKCHPKKNIITRALGLYEDILIDFSEVDFESGDKLLLCSDGLSNMISDDKFMSYMSDGQSQDYAVRLIDAANAAGGYDNITAVVIEN